MPANNKIPDPNVEKKAPLSPPESDLVITPAGPVRKDSVHQVKQNESVRREKDGTYTIVPNPTSK